MALGVNYMTLVFCVFEFPISLSFSADLTSVYKIAWNINILYYCTCFSVHIVSAEKVIRRKLSTLVIIMTYLLKHNKNYARNYAFPNLLFSQSIKFSMPNCDDLIEKEFVQVNVIYINRCFWVLNIHIKKYYQFVHSLTRQCVVNCKHQIMIMHFIDLLYISHSSKDLVVDNYLGKCYVLHHVSSCRIKSVPIYLTFISVLYQRLLGSSAGSIKVAISCFGGGHDPVRVVDPAE